MNFKRLIIFITIIVFSLGLISCNSARPMTNDRLNELNFGGDEEIADKNFQKIIEALENKDKEVLKKMFSTQASKDADDIDGGIDYIMDFYKGKMKSKKRGIGREDLKNNGNKKSELDCVYIVTTDEDTYRVFFIDQIVDNQNPDNIGIYMIQVIKESDKEKEFDGGGEKTRCAGIYRPDSAK